MFWGYIGVWAFCWGTGIPLVAMPGTGMWGFVGWALTAVGFICLWMAWKARDSETAQEEAAMMDDHSTQDNHSAEQGDHSTYVDESVTSHDAQPGSITAHTVHVAETPPNIDVAILKENAEQGDAFVTSVGIDLSGRPARFGVAALGKHIRELTLRQDGSSTALFNVEKGETDQGAHIFSCGNPPPGRYIAEIESTDRESDLKIEPFISSNG
jgi:hypothetical protein